MKLRTTSGRDAKLKSYGKRQKRFLKYSSNCLILFLVGLVTLYLVALSSILKIDSNTEHKLQQSRRKAATKNENHSPSRVTDNDRDKVDVIEDIDHALDEDDQRLTIGVASTITGCGSDPFVDGAAVLKYSLNIHSQRASSKFRYHNYILYHPSARDCALPLEDLGYTLLERPTPIKVEEIGGNGVLRERIVNNGCCGEKELIKLEAFRLTDHPLVIHLDLDVIINKPMDDVLDFMLNPERYKSSPDLLSKIPIMWPDKEIPNDISLLFTKDYNVVAPKRHDKPFQGGFFVIKPSLETYNEFLEVVRKGDYDVKEGWGNKVGPFYGGMTIQGLLPWYYEYLHPGEAVELNRCKYNNISDNPHLERNNGQKVCRTNEIECEDCRLANPDDIVTFHFTICQKPWHCMGYQGQKFELCRQMNSRWYKLRSALEKSWGRTGMGTGSFKSDRYNGFCTNKGFKGYQKIQQPYGLPG